MIPKIAHFKLFEGEGQDRWMKFIERFKELHPSWEIRVWKGMPRDVPRQLRSIMDSDKIDVLVKDEVFRAWALYSFGGVFVGNDTWMLQPMDDLMDGEDEAFICRSQNKSWFVVASKPGDHRLIDAVVTSMPIPSVIVPPGTIWFHAHSWKGWRVVNTAIFFPFSVGANARDFLRKPPLMQKEALAMEASKKGVNVWDIKGVSLFGRRPSTTSMKDPVLEESSRPVKPAVIEDVDEDDKVVEASLVQMGVSLAAEALKAGASFLKGDAVLETDNETERRMGICKECEFFIHKSQRCMKCGCRMKYKTRLNKAHCPVGKW